MRVARIGLRSFRNIRSCEIIPGPRLNLFVGSNAQGKTSLIEALGFLAMLRSFRGSHPPEVVQWGEETSDVSCSVETGEWRSDLRVHFFRQAEGHSKTSKIAFLNGKKFGSSIKYIEQKFRSNAGFHTIVFNPSDHELIRGEPRLRRDFLDGALSAQDPDYLHTLQHYRRTLQQRNALLKGYRHRQIPQYLDEFTLQLAQHGAALTQKRLNWLFEMEKRLSPILRKIAPNQEPVSIRYCSNWILSESKRDVLMKQFPGQDTLPSLQTLERTFLNKAAGIAEKERVLETTLIGSHRDDWVLDFGSASLKGHGSQGEIRSVLLALKLAEIEIFREQTGFTPVLLLDDFSSELDEARRRFLLNELADRDLQVFVTTTERQPGLPGKRFSVSDGTVKEF